MIAHFHFARAAHSRRHREVATAARLRRQRAGRAEAEQPRRTAAGPRITVGESGYGGSAARGGVGADKELGVALLLLRVDHGPVQK